MHDHIVRYFVQPFSFILAFILHFLNPSSFYLILLLLILYFLTYIISCFPVLYFFLGMHLRYDWFIIITWKHLQKYVLYLNMVSVNNFNNTMTDFLWASHCFFNCFIVWQRGGGSCWTLQRGHWQSFTVRWAQPWSPPADGQLPAQHRGNWGTTGQLRSELPRIPSLSHLFTAAFWAVGHYAVISSVGGEQLGELSHVFLRRRPIEIVCERTSE